MKGVTYEKVIMFLKLHLKFACCWPMPRGATKFQIFGDRVFRLVSILHAMLLIIELSLTIIFRVDNIVEFLQATFALGILLEVPVQISLFTLQHDRLQNVITQMEDYYRQTKSDEKDVFQKYIDKCVSFYVTMLSIATVTMLGSFTEPLLRESNTFPLVIKYPFNVDQQPLRTIVYLHQTFGLYQGYCQLSSNVFIALLLWFTSARFEILSNKFRKVAKYSAWQICVREHQKLLRFAEEMSLSILCVVLSSLSVSTYTLVFGGVSILDRLPVSLKAEFFIACISSLVKVFLCAWPADYLMCMSSNIADVAYDSLWYKHGIHSQKIMLNILLRCQRPVILTIPGLFAALNFQYYTSYISTTFSYLMTFRIILSEDETN